MPQAVTGNWRAKDVLFGKGSLHSELQESTSRTRLRAIKINEGEKGRLQMVGNIMAKYQHAEEERNSKIMIRVKKTLKELEAYKRVLKSYRVDNFCTMRPGFGRRREIRTPNTFRRCQLETRVLNCGFSIDTLHPEVERVIDEQKPEKLKKKFHDKLLNVARGRSNFMIDRRITNDAMKRERAIGKKNLLDTVADDEQEPTTHVPGRPRRTNTFLTEDGDSD